MAHVTAPSPTTVIGVGIDTARYGHRVTFLRDDKQPAAPSLDVLESRDGYQQLQEALERLRARHPDAIFHVRMDCAGQYAVNLERFLRDLPLALEVSVGEPARNAAYRKAHFPKRKCDAGDSFATARYAVVERPPPSADLPAEYVALREVAGRLESQVVQTTRFLCQLHNLLARVFPELATLVAELRTSWILSLLSQYPTPARIARAKTESLEGIRYAKPAKIAAIQAAAKTSVGMLRGEIAESLVVQLVRDIEASKQAEKRLKQLLKRAFDTLPPGPHQLLNTIPGIGPATAAAIVAKVVCIDRFAAPTQLVSYFGIFPEEHTSGYDRSGAPAPPGSVSMSRQGNDLVRRYLWMAAQTAAMHNPAVRALYARQRSRGKRGDVAMGHCMRKLLHLVFAIWKSGRPFDPKHYPWEKSAPAEAQDSSPPAKLETAAGHKEDQASERKVVAAAASNVKADSHQVKSPGPRRRIDFANLRKQVTMEQALGQLGWLADLRGKPPQLRGPCPIHGQQQDRRRCFSVHLAKHVFRCFHQDCAAQGNVLDLWAAARHLPLYEAALDLASTFHLDPYANREEEPVPPHSSMSKPPQLAPVPKGVITPDAG
jgi:transposase